MPQPGVYYSPCPCKICANGGFHPFCPATAIALWPLVCFVGHPKPNLKPGPEPSFCSPTPWCSCEGACFLFGAGIILSFTDQLCFKGQLFSPTRWPHRPGQNSVGAKSPSAPQKGPAWQFAPSVHWAIVLLGLHVGLKWQGVGNHWRFRYHIRFFFAEFGAIAFRVELGGSFSFGWGEHCVSYVHSESGGHCRGH